MRSDCPLCGGTSLVTCFDREQSPVSQNGLFVTRESARAAAVAPLAIRACAGCGSSSTPRSALAYNTTVAMRTTRRRLAPSRNTWMRWPTASSRRCPARDGRHPRGGCGQGYFLDRLTTIGGERIRAAFGFDPAWRGDPARPKTSISARYFDRAAARDLPHIDAAASRHVIEHVDEPVAFLTSIASGLPRARSCSSRPLASSGSSTVALSRISSSSMARTSPGRLFASRCSAAGSAAWWWSTSSTASIYGHPPA